MGKDAPLAGSMFSRGPPSVRVHSSADEKGVHGTPYYAGYSNLVVGVQAVSVRSSAFTRSWAA